MRIQLDPLERLLAIEELKRLKARYFRFLDTKQWDDWGTVFTADARMEVPEADLELDGRDAIVQKVSAVLEGTRTVHHGHMPEIEIIGTDSARGVWGMFDFVEWTSKEEGARAGLVGYGHYLEEYVRDDGTWRIAKTRLERIRVDPLS